MSVKRCRRCNRIITNIRSMTHGFGNCCWKKHLAEITPEQRKLELMAGYSWAYWEVGVYMVTTPEHRVHRVELGETPDKDTCTCEAHEIRGKCPHPPWQRMELADLKAAVELIEQMKAEKRAASQAKREAKAARKSAKTDAEIEQDILEIFAA